MRRRDRRPGTHEAFAPRVREPRWPRLATHCSHDRVELMEDVVTDGIHRQILPVRNRLRRPLMISELVQPSRDWTTVHCSHRLEMCFMPPMKIILEASINSGQIPHDRVGTVHELAEVVTNGYDLFGPVGRVRTVDPRGVIVS